MPRKVGKLTRYDVGPDGKGGWKGEKQGSQRAIISTETKREAVQRTIQAAKRDGTASVRIRGRDGRVQEERTYPRSRDKHPPKG